MDKYTLFKEIKTNLQTSKAEHLLLQTPLWKAFLSLHPADMAEFISDLSREKVEFFMQSFPNKELKFAVFYQLSNNLKAYCLSFFKETDTVTALNMLTADELTDLFDFFSDQELEKYLSMLGKKARKDVIQLMKFHPESAGGVMEFQVVTLLEDFTVEKSIQILQRLRPKKDIHQQLYVTNKTHHLVGHIQLEDLVLQSPKKRIYEFMKKNDLVIDAKEDQEAVAQKMHHYSLTSVPVVGDNNYFLGVIPAETLVDILVEEAIEDVHKMAALPLKQPYFETSFFTIFYQRFYILVILLLAESFSGSILRSYEATLTTFLMSFLPMLVNAGGGASGQTSTIVIQGIASGDINRGNMLRFLRRECLMAVVLGTSLGIVSFARIIFREGTIRLYECIAIGFAVCCVTITSIILGAGIPFLLKQFKIDPAFSAGPFLATLMDMFGVLIFCYIAKLIVFH